MYKHQNRLFAKKSSDSVPGEHPLELSLSLFAAAFDAITDIVVILSPDHNILYINKAGSESLQLSLEELVGKKCFHAVHCMEAPIKECPCTMSLKTNRPQSTEYESKGKHYSLLAWPIVSEKGRILALIHIVKDVTELKLAEKLNLDAKNEWEGVFNTISDMITIHDNDFNIIRANKAAEKILGLPFLANKPDVKCFRQYHGTEKPPDDCPSCNCLETGLPLTSEIFEPYLNKFLEIRAIPRTERNGQLTGLIHVVRDISERKKIEMELIQSKEKAEQSDKLKSAFLANMSHEIHTPLNAIVGFSELLSNTDLTIEEHTQYSTIVKSRTDDLLHIIDDILEISRIESGSVIVTKEPVALNKILDELNVIFHNKLQRYKNKRVNLICEKQLSDEHSIMNTDGIILRQVFSNLIDNAIKYTESGSITVGYKVLADNLITCFVSDTGIGIAPENQKIIFENFRQAGIADQHKFGGTGLGLSICKGSLALLEGKIWVESTPDEGSTFFFTLPCEQYLTSSNEHEVARFRETKKLTFNWGGKKLLLVEDDESNMEFLKVILNKTQVELVCAGNGSELRKLFKNLEIFDLVLLDIRLPDASGLDLVKEIKAIRPDLPVIAQTSYAMEQDKQKSIHAGFDDYISKPINKDLLLTLISGFLKNNNNNEKIEGTFVQTD